MRVRDDRLTPNDVSVVEKVKASIKDGVSVEELGENVLSAVDIKHPAVGAQHKRRRVD